MDCIACCSANRSAARSNICCATARAMFVCITSWMGGAIGVGVPPVASLTTPRGRYAAPLPASYERLRTAAAPVAHGAASSVALGVSGRRARSCGSIGIRAISGCCIDIIPNKTSGGCEDSMSDLALGGANSARGDVEVISYIPRVVGYADVCAADPAVVFAGYEDGGGCSDSVTCCACPLPTDAPTGACMYGFVCMGGRLCLPVLCCSVLRALDRVPSPPSEPLLAPASLVR